MKLKPFSACLVLLVAAMAPAAAASDCDQAPREASAQHGRPAGPSLAAITACTKIATPAKRLDCYDALTGHSD